MGVKLVSSSGGSVELVAPTTASNFTHTVPAQTGTVLLKESTSGMQVPAFHAYGNANQSVTSNVGTKAQINTKSFDTASCFDSTTNYRFTPNVAGYYFVYGTIGAYSNNSTLSESFAAIYKNGSTAIQNGNKTGSTSGLYNYQGVSGLLYMNGTTDYVELYGMVNGGSPLFANNSGNSLYFGAYLVRAA